MLRHLGLLAVCACVGVSVGCEDRNLTGPAPPPSSSGPPSSGSNATVTVAFGGRLVNADAGGPVANVRVTVAAWGSPSERSWIGGEALFKAIATSGGDGTFTLPLDLPSDWKLVYLKFTGPAGYEVTEERFEPTAAPCRIGPCWAAAARPAIQIYPTLVIRPGESVSVRVAADMPWCGWAGDAGPCRRVLVEASPGDPVELEIVPDDSRKPMALSLESPFFEPDMSVRRLMVPPGGFPYVFGAGTARLTARR